MGRIELNQDGYCCCRCGHTWTARRDLTPRICPKCKSSRWNDDEQTNASRNLCEKIANLDKAKVGIAKSEAPFANEMIDMIDEQIKKLVIELGKL